MSQLADTNTTKTTVRFIVQALNTRTGEWHTHDARYAYSSNRKAPGVYTDLADAKWHYNREAKYRAPGTFRIIQSEIVSTWTEVYV